MKVNIKLQIITTIVLSLVSLGYIFRASLRRNSQGETAKENVEMEKQAKASLERENNLTQSAHSLLLEDKLLPNLVNSQKGSHIIIFTQSRSGSSFLGSILQHRPNTFYSFEPLRFFKFTDTPNAFEDNVLLGTNVSYFLLHLLNCNLQHILDVSQQTHPEMEESRQIWIPYAFPKFKTTESATMACTSSHNVVIKIIRVKYLRYIVPTLTSRNVTILHLIRDPRGRLNSALNLKLRPEIHFLDTQSGDQNLFHPKIKDYIMTKAKRHCQKLEDNYKYLKNVQSVMTNSINFVTARYEDFAYHPKEMAVKLLKYFNEVPDDKFMGWLHNVTTSSFENSPYIPIRNSIKTAEAWRYTLPFHLVDIIQEQCKDVLRTYGYKLAKSQDILTDTSKSLVGKIAGDLSQL